MNMKAIWKGNEFKSGEIVWHTAFKIKVVVIAFIKCYGGWWAIELPNGGVMETQKISKLKKHDKL